MQMNAARRLRRPVCVARDGLIGAAREHTQRQGDLEMNQSINKLIDLPLN